jgi:hypothetical protein
MNNTVTPAPDRITIGSVTMPPDTYWVGDPCYGVPESLWMPWLEAADYKNERRFLIADIDGKPVLGVGTAHGDGVYYDQAGFAYGVDAGLIGLVPVGIEDPKHNNLYTLFGCQQVVFPQEFKCSYNECDEGAIWLGHICIKTDRWDWDEEIMEMKC